MRMHCSAGGAFMLQVVECDWPGRGDFITALGVLETKKGSFNSRAK